MRHLGYSGLVAGMFAAVVLASGGARAQVNYGDFNGTGVDFDAVTETTQSAGDPATLWGAPSLGATGDQLVFFPPAFVSSCASGASDVTESVLTTTIQAQAGVHIDTLMLAETGDATLTAFPPFGTAATNVAAGLTGTVTVTQDTSGPIAPVVIPFTGTFTPSDTFALPTNFGGSTWTGNISVDIASQVPNATQVEVSLDNALAANCAAGNTSASIQKKSVSGPAVALMVNPVSCNLEVDKTCCVTQPVLPDLDICDGQATRLVLEYTGSKCGRSSNDQGKSFCCHGHRSIGEPASISAYGYGGGITVTPSSGIHFGDLVEFTSASGTLPEKIKLAIQGPLGRKQHFTLDTSCNRAIQCDDQFGAFKVVGVDSTLGGAVDCNAPPPPPQCVGAGDPAGTPCDAKLVDMVLEYHGRDCQSPLPNPQNGEAECDGNATGATNVGVVYTGKFGYKQQVSPASNINDGDRIRVTATWPGGLYPNQSYKIVDSNGVLQTVKFHVSCSQPLALGDEFGSFKLVEWTTKNGTHLALGDGGNGQLDACEIPLAPPGPHCTSDLQGLTLVYIGDYLGEGCSVSNPQGGYGTCSGVADPGDPVSVTVGSGLDADPTDLIEFGDLVTITPTAGGDLPTLTNVDVTGANGSQAIQIKTSCSKPLSLGDRFGSFVVFGMDRQEEGPITLGGNIQYQYKVTNPNADTVENVQVSDDQLGVIASGESLAPGEVKTFTTSATLYGTTTNVATATGDVMGSVCEPGVDQVTVGVQAPPPGSFFCSEPISELTTIWNGAQTVDVKAWEGAPGGTLLGFFDNVAPGEAITVSGFGNDYPIYEIFNSSSTVKLGQSSFDLWCSDWSMNGVEDCGKNIGNLKWNDPNLIDDWLLEGMVDTDETLECTPGLVPSPPTCGFGPELMFVMPGLWWLHRRRLRRR
jgi:hypothetical protein